MPILIDWLLCLLGIGLFFLFVEKGKSILRHREEDEEKEEKD